MKVRSMLFMMADMLYKRILGSSTSPTNRATESYRIRKPQEDRTSRSSLRNDRAESLKSKHDRCDNCYYLREIPKQTEPRLFTQNESMLRNLSFYTKSLETERWLQCTILAWVGVHSTCLQSPSDPGFLLPFQAVLYSGAFGRCSMPTKGCFSISNLLVPP